MNVWTKEEAHRMAFRKYRHSYLPPNLKDKLKFESFEESSFINDEKINEWSNRKVGTEIASKRQEYDDDLPF